MTDIGGRDDRFWSLFTQLTTKLKSLKLLHFFADHAVSEVAQRKVLYICKRIHAFLCLNLALNCRL